MRYVCLVCGEATKATNPNHRRAREANNRCKSCLYTIEDYMSLGMKPRAAYLQYV